MSGRDRTGPPGKLENLTKRKESLSNAYKLPLESDDNADKRVRPELDGRVKVDGTPI